MAFKKQNVFDYKNKKIAHEFKNNRHGQSILFNKNFSLDEKIDYYSNRINDKSLTSRQRKYAKIKTSMLTSGIGRIFLIKDGELGNRNQPLKDRRVIPTAINYRNGNTLINGIYTSTNKFKDLEISTLDDEGRIYILNKTSFLDIQSRMKDKNKYFNIKDLNETTSTINPFQLKDVINYVYPKRERSVVHFRNNFNRSKLKK